MVALETVEGAPVVHDYTFPRRCALLLVGRLLWIALLRLRASRLCPEAPFIRAFGSGTCSACC